MASSGSLRRPSSINMSSNMAPTSPVGNMTTSSLSLPDDSFSNNPEDYDIQRPIGYGSSAVVYNAYYKPLNKRVAIKVIDLDMFERNQIDELRRETQVMALCKHPNVLRVNGAFVTDSKLYIVTPYLSAGSCLDIMKIAYPDGLDEVSIATILKQALQGLDYLHKNGHIHRDVKAGNLLMDEDGSVLLADFGVSSSLMETGDRRGMRKTFVGTPCWMAPEVMEQAGYDYKADIWSFGITAIELATGHAPFARYPPIKVLMLTLSNDPPTLDRESTRHRFSKLLKEMIDSCLQKDPAKRPSAEKLLNHAFFKQAKKKSYLVSGLLHDLPPLEQRPPKKAAQTPVVQEKGVSWDFDGDETPIIEQRPQNSDNEPQRRPRTVTFEPSAVGALSVVTTELTPSTSSAITPTVETRTTDSLAGDTHSPQGSTPISNPVGPIKKSRFVVDGSTASSSPSMPPMADLNQPPQAVSSLGLSTPSIQSGQNLQGLGVSSSLSDHSALPEVRKGRFSVKDTSLGGSPLPSSIKTLPGEPHLSLPRSLTSSPIEGTPDGVRISGSPLEQAPSSAERKSRFEVHHTPTPTPMVSVSNVGTGPNSPALMGILGTPLSRESSQSRVAGDTGLTRDNSTTRVSRFSIEPSVNPSEGSAVPNSTTVSSTGTPNPASSAGIQSKRSRFLVSSIESTRPSGEHVSGDVPSSTHSTPTTSPTGSILRGQPALLEALGAQSVRNHLEILYRQNEQQRTVLQELFAGFGLKAGSSSKIHHDGGLLYPMGSGGSVHRQEQGSGNLALERQLQIATRDNESLKRENDALKRELDRLRRGSL
ncbi:hypothetical protein BG011_003962 [Mortierella polycephala]|uniref:Protein kinase domain-containing protein n=1 Tax=Mortierella polycephala TaxID=41804 RepID=A0A9P6U2Z4_9FUNG|nr:hypothetical protein BG011_003962 [Mortierella polycephala]